MTNPGLDHLARTTYEASRGASPAPLPPWEDLTEQEQKAWTNSVSAIAAQVLTSQAADRYKEARDVWNDFNHRQEFEHDLINRKTTWWLTGQTILFAAYGLTLKKDFVGKSNEFPKAIVLTGLAVAIITFFGVLAVIISKIISWHDYKEFYKCNPQLARPLVKKPLRWGVRTLNTVLTLIPETLLPLIFVYAWYFLYGHLSR